EEMSLYTVKDRKIVREQFFYRTSSPAPLSRPPPRSLIRRSSPKRRRSHPTPLPFRAVPQHLPRRRNARQSKLFPNRSSFSPAPGPERRSVSSSAFAT